MTCCELHFAQRGMTSLIFELNTEELGDSAYTAVLRILTHDLGLEKMQLG